MQPQIEADGSIANKCGIARVRPELTPVIWPDPCICKGSHQIFDLCHELQKCPKVCARRGRCPHWRTSWIKPTDRGDTKHLLFLGDISSEIYLINRPDRGCVGHIWQFVEWESLSVPAWAYQPRLSDIYVADQNHLKMNKCESYCPQLPSGRFCFIYLNRLGSLLI